MIVPDSIRADLRPGGVSDSAFVTLGARPSVLRLLPAAWSALGCRVLWVEGDRAVLATTSMNHRRLGRVVASAPLHELEMASRFVGGQLRREAPRCHRHWGTVRSTVNAATLPIISALDTTEGGPGR